MEFVQAFSPASVCNIVMTEISSEVIYAKLYEDTNIMPYFPLRGKQHDRKVAHDSNIASQTSSACCVK